MHRQDGTPTVQGNNQMTALARSETGTFASQKAFGLSTVHQHIISDALMKSIFVILA